MANKYLDYISDEHFLSCVKNLHKSYLNSKNEITKRRFYKNKVDSIKLTFDAKFNNLNEEEIVESEILRQIDKSINNSIGTFHEQILGGVEGYEAGQLSGYDIKANDDTLFADIKNKHNTMNSSSAESLYQKLAKFADTHKQATCYWVQILATKSFNERWYGDINGKEYNHSRVYKISGDKFYALVTGRENAFLQLYTKLPEAINEYLGSLTQEEEVAHNSALEEIKDECSVTGRNVLDQITFDNYRYYNSFNEL